MIPCLCTDDAAETCSGGGVTPRGRTCVCRCHRDLAHAAMLADVHRALRGCGVLSRDADAVIHVAWLRAAAGTAPALRPS